MTSENRVSFMFSEKGKDLLCKAKVYTVGLNVNLINIHKSCFDHGYASDGTLKRLKISNSCKRKALDSIVERPSKIIRKDISKYPNEGDLIFLDLKLIARNIHDARINCYPKLSTSRKEFI
ncbi:Uncharacterized protein FWK35_00031929 [Aphis craccivora]|uniref:Uncharacterized protein n=1 Tax=Aphis craccivora TaxID=307492 RepID=A0A6G0VNQ8_APHCR|nr:Uncharacterized protein FWK35_00031929 [Aphis craccivora]